MALIKWTTGDTILETNANKRGVRKGTESEIAAIASGERENGDIFFNSTSKCPQIQLNSTSDKRGNIMLLIGADSTETPITSTSPVQVKDIDFIKSAEGFKGQTLTIIAMLKASANTAHLRVRKDGAGSDDLDLSTASASYVKVTGTIDITALSSDAVHTLEFYLENTTAGTATLKQLEVYGL